jgi:hypothetical protein
MGINRNWLVRILGAGDAVVWEPESTGQVLQWRNLVYKEQAHEELSWVFQE